MRKIYTCIACMIISFGILGCGSGSGSSGSKAAQVYPVDESLAGIWCRLDADETITLGDTTTLNIEQIEENLIEVNRWRNNLLRAP